MNLWFRLLSILLTVRLRPRLEPPHGVSRLTFRVWPWDLDPSLHMNNGRYLTLMDLGRLDIMLTSGLWRAVLAHRWTPIASKIAIRYRRELRLLHRFRLETRVVTWDDTAVIMEQSFILVGGSRDGQVAAHALFKGGLYDRKQRAFIPLSRLLSELSIKVPSPPPATTEVEAFLKADETMRLSQGQRFEPGT